MGRRGFYTIIIDQVIRETDECVSVSFQVPDHLKVAFQYQPGQYLTLAKSINGEEVRRSYSLCSSPSENQWKVAIKKVPEGLFSTYANEVLKPGDEIDVMPPQGNFLINDKQDKDYYIFFTAGSGITPVMSMVKHILEEREENLMLFYGNKSIDTIIFREELEALKSKYLGRLSLHFILSRERLGSPHFFGRIDGQKCKLYLEKIIDDNRVSQYLICGPSPMIFEVEKTLLEAGVNEDRIKYELFTTEDFPKDKKREKINTKDQEDQMALIRFKLDGIISDFSLPYHGIPLLDGAMHSGADVPYSCKGGVCSTCKAKLVKGEVEMDVNYALEPEEIAAGYILTCQSHPRSPEIEIDFDET